MWVSSEVTIDSVSSEIKLCHLVWADKQPAKTAGQNSRSKEPVKSQTHMTRSAEFDETYLIQMRGEAGQI